MRLDLSEKQIQSLRAAVLRRAPQSLALVHDLSSCELQHQDRLALADVVLEELMSSGIGPDGEINQTGIDLDNLISALKPSEEDE